MPNESSASTSAPVFRVDKFVVPAEALPTFIEQMQHIQRAVRSLPGCQRDLLLTQTGGAGEFNVVRMIEWASAQAVAAAVEVMQKKFADEGFDPAAFVQRLGVRADLGLYSKA